MDDSNKHGRAVRSLSEYVCDGSHTHGQSRGTALKLAENYTFTLTDFIHRCFRSRANQAQTAKNRKRLALPAMSRRSDDAPMTIAEKMNVRALKSAGLETMTQQSNMSELLAFRKCLDVQEDRHAGWEDIFSTVLALSTILASGNRIEDLELGATGSTGRLERHHGQGQGQHCVVEQTAEGIEG